MDILLLVASIWTALILIVLVIWNDLCKANKRFEDEE